MNDHKKQVQTSTLSLQRYLEVGKKARELFHVLDSDGDGKIQAKELVQVIGENHAGRMLSAIDGILENKEANGFIEPVEFQHYFEYIIARDGYDASIEALRWIEDWVQHRKDEYALRCRERLGAIVIIQSRFRGSRLRRDRKRWNEKFEIQRKIVRLGNEKKKAEEEKARAKRVGMMRKWNVTRLRSKLQDCESKLQDAQEHLDEYKKALCEQKERTKMSIEESRMKTCFTEELKRKHAMEIEHLKSAHHQCICESEKQRVRESKLRHAQIKRAVQILREIQRKTLIHDVATRLHRDSAKAKVQEDDTKLSARLFRAIACDDAHAIEFLAKQSNVFPGRILSLHNKADETPIEFASRRRRARALRALRQLETTEREVLSLPPKEVESKGKQQQQQQQQQVQNINIETDIESVSVPENTIVLDESKLRCTHVTEQEEESSTTKRRLMDARRIAKKLENVRTPQIIKDIVVKITTRLKSNMSRFERQCFESILSFSKRLEASEHLVMSCVEMPLLLRHRPVTIRGSGDDDGEKKEEEADIIKKKDVVIVEKKETNKEKEGEETKDMAVARAKSRRIEAKSRTKSEIEAELFALRMRRRLKAASVRMKRAQRDTSKTYATLQCRIKGLEDELRQREDALQVASLATRDLWHRLMKSSSSIDMKSDIASICSSHHSSSDLYDNPEIREEDYDIFMQLLLRHGPTKRIWSILTRKRRARNALRPGSAYMELLNQEARRIQVWWRKARDDDDIHHHQVVV